MEYLFKEEKDSLELCEEEGKYIEAIQICKTLIKKIKNTNDEDMNVKKELYYAYYMLAKVYKNCYGISKINIAIEYAQKAFKYNYNQMEYMRSIWLLAECYLISNRPDKAIKIYKRCSQYYYNHKLNDCYLSVLFNIAKLSDRTNLMLLIIKKYEKTFVNDTRTIRDMYIELFDIYLYLNDDESLKKAIGLLHSIKDKSLVKLLSKKLLVA